MYCNVSFPPPLLEDGRKQFSYWNVQLVHHFITDLGCSISFFFFCSLFTSRALDIWNLDGIILESMHIWSLGMFSV